MRNSLNGENPLVEIYLRHLTSLDDDVKMGLLLGRVEKPDNYLGKVFVYALEEKKLKALRLIITRATNIDIYKYYEDNVLEFLCEQRDLNTIKLFLGKIRGALDNDARVDAFFPLTKEAIFAAIKNEDVAILKYLYATFDCPHFLERVAFRTSNYDVLNAALKVGNLEILKVVLPSNPRYAYIIKHIFFKAIANGKYEIVKYLLDHYKEVLDSHAKLDKSSVKKALFKAVEGGHTEILKYMSKQPYSLSYPFIDYEDRLKMASIAIKNGHYQTLEYMMEDGVLRYEISLLQVIAGCGDFKACQPLIKNGTPIASNSTILERAIIGGSTERIQSLLDTEHISQEPEQPFSPNDYADIKLSIENGLTMSAQSMITKKFDSLSQEQKNKILIAAVKEGNKPLVVFLLDLGFTPELIDWNGTHEKDVYQCARTVVMRDPYHSQLRNIYFAAVDFGDVEIVQRCFEKNLIDEASLWRSKTTAYDISPQMHDLLYKGRDTWDICNIAFNIRLYYHCFPGGYPEVKQHCSFKTHRHTNGFWSEGMKKYDELARWFESFTGMSLISDYPKYKEAAWQFAQLRGVSCNAHKYFNKGLSLNITLPTCDCSVDMLKIVAASFNRIMVDNLPLKDREKLGFIGSKKSVIDYLKYIPRIMDAKLSIGL